MVDQNEDKYMHALVRLSRLQITSRCSFYSSNPLVNRTLPTAPCLNSALLFMRISSFPATMLTPSRIRRESGSLNVDVIFILNSARSPLWCFTQCFHIAFSSFLFLIALKCSFPRVNPFLADSPQYVDFCGPSMIGSPSSIFPNEPLFVLLRTSDGPFSAHVTQSIL